LHSGINFVTPNDRLAGRDRERQAHRKQVYEQAKQQTPGDGLEQPATGSPSGLCR
tara:strand:+ start:921 stop:1085 length:165 start_codon:yes stop_codon:yes gene_type:complete